MNIEIVAETKEGNRMLSAEVLLYNHARNVETLRMDILFDPDIEDNIEDESYKKDKDKRSKWRLHYLNAIAQLATVVNELRLAGLEYEEVKAANPKGEIK